MSRRVVSEIQCSRCARVETGPAESMPPPGMDDGPAAFVAKLGALKVQFEDLCVPCTKAVKTHLDAIGKKIEGLSPERAERAPKAPKPKVVKPDVAVIDVDATGAKPATVTHIKKAKDA